MDSIREAARNAKEQAQKLVGNEPEPEELSAADSMRQSLQETQQAAAEAMNEVCPELTYKQRLIGFVICAACGYLLSFGSFIRFGNVRNVLPAALFVERCLVLSFSFQARHSSLLKAH